MWYWSFTLISKCLRIHRSGWSCRYYPFSSVSVLAEQDALFTAAAQHCVPGLEELNSPHQVLAGSSCNQTSPSPFLYKQIFGWKGRSGKFLKTVPVLWLSVDFASDHVEDIMHGPLKHTSFCYGKMKGRCGCRVRRCGGEKLSFLKLQNWHISCIGILDGGT